VTVEEDDRPAGPAVVVRERCGGHPAGYEGGGASACFV
jgi:hypothetical protein